MKKRIFSIFMVFALCFVSVDQVYADAGSLIIAGGSVAGVTAGAIAGPAVVAVFCAMMAFGMNVELSQASEEAGMTKTQFLKTKIEQYCTEAQISYNTFNQYILDQANVFQNGAISLTDKAGNLIQKFCNWLFETDAVSPGQVPSLVVNGRNYNIIQSGDTGTICSYNVSGKGREILYVCNESSYPISIYIREDGEYYYLGVFSNQAFENISLRWVQKDANGNVEFDRIITNYQYHYQNGYVREFQALDFNIIDKNSLSTTIPIFVGGMGEFMGAVEGISTSGDTITGNETDYDTSKHVLNPTQDKTIVINPNVTIPVPQDKDVTIDVNEYLEIVQDLIDGVAEDIITAIDDATGVPITIEFDPTQDWDPTIEKEDDTDLQDDEKDPIVEEDIIPYDFDPDPMKFDLKGIFPFCIPWDVKDMLSKLSADPVAPSYTVNWEIPIINERLIFTVDLSPFNDVAQVCRTMELLVLCIGLAIVTRQLFLRG